ncbi:MAG: hypothetical protein H6Q90_6933 [Deltaproteobacteria bacterium]|nr:hypothetical protein [Deltaproteobacteria bacterium]
MNLTKSFLILAVLLFTPAVASAQYGGGGGGRGGYYNNPQNTQLPGGFHNRMGRLIYGASLGLGGMNENGEKVDCGSCNYSPIAGMGSLHVGGFVGPRLALMGEVQGNIQTIGTDGYDSEALVQSTLMFAAQYWISPQLWIKGGIGVANLRVDHTYYGTVEEVPENGLALLGAIGYEVLSAQRFSVDLQGRLINGSYDRAGVNISAASVGIGINWF